MRFGANGICKSVNTACASANDAIGEAFRSIKFGYQDVMLVGGSEASITPFAIAGFQALTALSTTEDPKRASIPLTRTAMALSWVKVLVCWFWKVWNMLRSAELLS